MFSKLIQKSFLKNVLISILLACTILVIPACFERYNIHEVHNLEMLKEEISSLDENSLVIFDMDDTLIFAEDFFGSSVNKKAFDTWYPLHEKLRKQISQKKFDGLMHRIDPERRLVDKDVPNLIERMCKQKAKVCALTKGGTGKGSNSKSREEHRFQLLQKFGIDFRSSFPKYESITLSEILEKGSSAPMFYKGILLSARSTKRQTLEAFLNRINWWPKKIIFIDDQLEKLNEIAQLAKDKNIKFLGLHYLAVEDMPFDIEPEVAEFMFKYLLEHEEWLPVDEARRHLQGTK